MARRFSFPLLVAGTVFLGMLGATCSIEPEMQLDGSIFFTMTSGTSGKSIEMASFQADAEKLPKAVAFFTKLPKVPEPETFEILAVIPLEEQSAVFITRRHGIFQVDKRDGLWTRIDTNLPKEVVYPFKNNGITKPAVSCSISADFKRIAMLYANALYLSYDGGKTFTAGALKGIYHSSELLSVAWHPEDKNRLLVGTSFSGIYYSLDEGKNWENIEKGVPGEPVNHPSELDEVRSLCFGETPDVFYAGMGNGQGILRGEISKKTVTRLFEKELVSYPDGDFYCIENLNYYRGNLLFGTNRGWRKIVKVADSALVPDKNFVKMFVSQQDAVSMYTDNMVFPLMKNYLPARKFEPDSRGKNKKGLYISHSIATGQNYPRLLQKLKLLNLNAVVIDLKDDEGNIRVPSDDPVLNKAGGIRFPYKDIREIIQHFKKDGIYVIGRHVVFKDNILYKLDNYKYAAKTSAGNPLPKGPEKWVDPYSEFVWDYNIRAAQAMIDVGVDEIQFDYIRFPDRVRLDNTRYDFQKKGQIMREALASFLKKAQEKLDVPVSIDVFGYMAVYKYGNSIGQDISEMAQYVDVVSPMFYPSHYSRTYGRGFGKKQIYYIILLSMKRTDALIGDALLRPYIQAFYYKDDWDHFGVDYIGWQLAGIKDSGNTDYIFWNAAMNHQTLIEGMAKYVKNNNTAVFN